VPVLVSKPVVKTVLMVNESLAAESMHVIGTTELVTSDVNGELRVSVEVTKEKSDVACCGLELLEDAEVIVVTPSSTTEVASFVEVNAVMPSVIVATDIVVGNVSFVKLGATAVSVADVKDVSVSLAVVAGVISTVLVAIVVGTKVSLSADVCEIAVLVLVAIDGASESVTVVDEKKSLALVVGATVSEVVVAVVKTVSVFEVVSTKASVVVVLDGAP
jgi:hypothetical protein